MYILIDSRIPAKSKAKLSEYGELIEFPENNDVYSAISAHPDIFCCNATDKLIVATNVSHEILEIFEKKNIYFALGKKKLGRSYPKTAHYNAVTTNKYLIHNLKITDLSIKINDNNLIKVNVNQGYTRCNLLALDEDYFITSDKGIYNKVNEFAPDKVFFINPNPILLPGFKHGFFGGCCGYFNRTIYIIGNIKHLPENYLLSEFIEKSGNKIINLSDHQLFDGGGIFFISK